MTPRKAFLIGLKAIGLYLLIWSVGGVIQYAILAVLVAARTVSWRDVVPSAAYNLAVLAIGVVLLFGARCAACWLYPARRKCCEACGYTFAGARQSDAACPDCGAARTASTPRHSNTCSPPWVGRRRLAAGMLQVIGLIALIAGVESTIWLATGIGYRGASDVLWTTPTVAGSLVTVALGLLLLVAARPIAARLAPRDDTTPQSPGVQ